MRKEQDSMIQLGKCFHHPQLKHSIDNHKCLACQMCEKVGTSQLPMEEAALIAFEEPHTDLMVPWMVEVQGKDIEMKAPTCMEPVTNLVEPI